MTEAPRVDLATGIYLTLAAIFCGYAGYQEGWTAKVLSISLLHALAHFAAIVCLAWLAATLDLRLFGLYDGPWWLWLVALTVIIVPVGTAIAGFIFGTYPLFDLPFRKYEP